MSAYPRGKCRFDSPRSCGDTLENTFLEDVARFARERNVPVFLEGSSLGHAFYQLSSHGATLLSSSSAGSRRARSRRVFYKLVRDKIPERIAKGGGESRCSGDREV